jgi:SynChlorMet cassette protein ScmC
MNNCFNNPYTKSYSLNLKDGNNWIIVSDEQNTQMLDKLATIMRLKECKLSNSPMLIFAEIIEDKKLADSIVWRHDNLDFPNIRIRYNSNTEDILCELKGKKHDLTKYINMLCSIRPIYKRSISIGGIPFHAGLAQLDEHGVLFVASGGIGKSTCCRRLPNYWKTLCDDETLVVLDNRGKFLAHPFPTWSDYFMDCANKTWDVQYSVPISAIFFLARANKDEVIPLTIGETASLITESASQVCVYYKGMFKKTLEEVSSLQDELINFRREIFDNAFDMAMVIPAFQLRISLNGKFWEEVERIISL